MSEKWTPGKLAGTVVSDTPHNNDRRYFVMHGGFLIAESIPKKYVNLIAAAPDLLEALEDLGNWLAYGLDKPEGAKPTAEDLRRCEEVAAKARKAVDKARKAPQ